MLKAYMGSGEDSTEGACLIFAHTAKEAKRIGYKDWARIWDIDFIEVRVRKLKQTDYLFSLADKGKLEKDIPHIIDDMPVCERCELWSEEPLNENGLCNDCRDYEEFEEEYNTEKRFIGCPTEI